MHWNLFLKTKTQKMCDNTYPSAINFALVYYKNQEMCHKAVHKCCFVLGSIPDQYNTQEIIEKVVSEDPFLIAYCPDKYKTQRMRD